MTKHNERRKRDEISLQIQRSILSMKTTMTSGRSSENGGRFASGHFAGGHDGMTNLCKPITAYDFHVRYTNKFYFTSRENRMP